MTIAEQITRIKNAKAAIKQSIENKGVTVSDTAKLDEYPALIDSISGEGGGDSNNHYWPDFFELKTGHGKNNISYRYLFYYSYATDIVFPNIDSSQVIDMGYMFANCSSLQSLDISNLRTDSVTTMQDMFYYLPKSITSLDLSHFSTNNVTDMSYMFSGCSGLTSLDLSSFDANKVTTMKNMFYLCADLQTIIGLENINANSLTGAAINSMFQSCKSIVSLDLSGLNVSNVTEMQSIYDGCQNLEYINITGWDTSKAYTLYKVFTDCKKLVTIDGVLDGSGLKNGLYNGSATHPFYNCTSLETLYLKNIYKDVSITNAAKFSIDLGATKVKDECLVYIINELPDLINNKGLTATDKIVLTLPPSNTLTEEQVQVAILKGWQVANTTY